jgi:subtilase family serine protease
MSKVAITGNASGTGTFTIASPNSSTDRTLNLPDNSGTVVTTGSTDAVTEAMLATAVTPIGVDQTWQNVTASRASGTTYTNTTGRPIFGFVTYGQAGVTAATLFLDGVTAGAPSIPGISSTMSISFVVRISGTYRVDTAGGLQAWLELR